MIENFLKISNSKNNFKLNFLNKLDIKHEVIDSILIKKQFLIILGYYLKFYCLTLLKNAFKMIAIF